MIGQLGVFKDDLKVLISNFTLPLALDLAQISEWLWAKLMTRLH
jgi:hypothetical protein